MTLTAQDILDEVARRKRELEQRRQRYRDAQKAYDGESTVEQYSEQSMDRSGRPIDRLTLKRNELQRRSGTPNMIIPIVDDQVALVGRIPQMRVLPWSDDKELEHDVRRLSRVLRAQWLHSNMALQNVEAARWIMLKRECLYHLTAVYPDEAERRGIEPGMYITTVDPELCLPSFGGGWDRHLLEDVIIQERVSAFVAKRTWGDVIGDPGGDVDVYHYIGKEANHVVVDDRMVASVEHHLGFTPAVWVQTQPGSRQSTVNAVLDLHNEMAVIFAVMVDTLLDATYATLVVEDPQKFDDRFETGPGAPPIVTKAGGRAYRLTPGAVPDVAQGLLATTWDHITRVSGVAPVRLEGSLDQSNISGRAVSGVQGPMQQRLQLSYDVLSHLFQTLNSMMMLAFFRLEPFKAEMQVCGVEVVGDGDIVRQSVAYVETFTGQDFRGWSRNEVSFSSPLGTNTHEQYLVLGNLHKEGAISGPFMLDQLRFPDADKVFAQGQAEFHERMAGMPPPGGPHGAARHGGAPPPQGGMAGPPGESPPQAADGGGPPTSGMGGVPGASTPGDGTPPPAQPPPSMPPVDTAPTNPAKAFPGPLPGGDVMRRIKQAITVAQATYHGVILDAQPIPGGVRVTVESASTGGSSKAPVRQAFHASGFDEVQVVDARGKNGST
jgi:hypothetical protein